MLWQYMRSVRPELFMSVLDGYVVINGNTKVDCQLSIGEGATGCPPAPIVSVPIAPNGRFFPHSVYNEHVGGTIGMDALWENSRGKARSQDKQDAREKLRADQRMPASCTSTAGLGSVRGRWDAPRHPSSPRGQGCQRQRERH